VEEGLRHAPAATLRLLRVIAASAELFPAFPASVLSLALFEAAYVAEIVRSGVQSIERGQWAATLGLNSLR